MEIEFRPIKKIVILEETRHGSPEDLFLVATASVQPDTVLTVLWAEGIVFIPSPLPPSEETVRERMDGVIFWNSVDFARMDEFEREKTVGMHTIRIIKATGPGFIAIAKKLRERLSAV